MTSFGASRGRPANELEITSWDAEFFSAAMRLGERFNVTVGIPDHVALVAFGYDGSMRNATSSTQTPHPAVFETRLRFKLFVVACSSADVR